MTRECRSPFGPKRRYPTRQAARTAAKAVPDIPATAATVPGFGPDFTQEPREGASCTQMTPDTENAT